jgi:putative transposase
VQYLKGKSSHKLLTEYQSLRKRYWGQHPWSRGEEGSRSVKDEVLDAGRPPKTSE